MNGANGKPGKHVHTLAEMMAHDKDLDTAKLTHVPERTTKKKNAMLGFHVLVNIKQYNNNKDMLKKILLDWSEYGSWLQCSRSCGGGSKTRMRHCNGGSPGSFGCEGEQIEQAPCNEHPCGKLFFQS